MPPVRSLSAPVVQQHAVDTFYQRAYSLVGSQQAREAFDLNKEANAVTAFSDAELGTIVIVEGRIAQETREKLLALGPPRLSDAELLALFLGQDTNWDLRNYHWYNPYSFLNGRFFFDVVPAQTPSFYNPTLDVPFFLLGNAVPAPVAGSTILISTCGWTLPMVAVRRSRSSSLRVWQETGEVSVIP